MKKTTEEIRNEIADLDRQNEVLLAKFLAKLNKNRGGISNVMLSF